jgi:hypothetical protein
MRCAGISRAIERNLPFSVVDNCIRNRKTPARSRRRHGWFRNFPARYVPSRRDCMSVCYSELSDWTFHEVPTLPKFTTAVIVVPFIAQAATLPEVSVQRMLAFPTPL